MSEHVLKSHNKTLLLYHIVCPAKYRRRVFSDAVTETLKEVCKEIAERYDVSFVEIGSDEDHIHFLVQSVPMMSVSRLVMLIKSLTAKEIFSNHKEVKKILWGGSIWSSGFYANTVGQYANENVITKYVKNQGKHYQQIHRGQLKLFEGLA